MQVFDESDVDKFNFDILDPTKIIPEEIIPITPLGKIQLNRNPVNYFAETEQIMVMMLPSPPFFIFTRIKQF